MNERLYNRLNNIFITISLILIIIASIFDEVFNIIPQITLLFGSISSLINGKFKLKKHTRISFKEQFTLGIIFSIFSSFLIIGYILQLLPFTENEIIEKIEKNLARVKPVTQLLDQGMDIEDIVRDVLQGFDVEVIYEEQVEYKCKCSREKIQATLGGLGKEELEGMYSDLPQVDVKCHFCNTDYTFTKDDIKGILKKIEKN